MRYHAKGITLIEVLGGLALLATLVVALIAIQARYTRQWAVSGRRLDAAKAADVLLADWWKRLDDFPRNESGDVPGPAQLRWRTIIVDNEVMPELACQKVRLEIAERNDSQQILIEVELLLPPPEAPPESHPVSHAGAPAGDASGLLRIPMENPIGNVSEPAEGSVSATRTTIAKEAATIGKAGHTSRPFPGVRS